MAATLWLLKIHQTLVCVDNDKAELSASADHRRLRLAPLRLSVGTKVTGAFSFTYSQDQHSA